MGHSRALLGHENFDAFGFFADGARLVAGFLGFPQVGVAPDRAEIAKGWPGVGLAFATGAFRCDRPPCARSCLTTSTAAGWSARLRNDDVHIQSYDTTKYD